MYSYIQDQLKKRLHEDDTVVESVTTTDAIEDSDVFLECATSIAELQDLTEDGIGTPTPRKIIDIPLDDDLELETIEINVTDGRITDIPKDATVQESSKMGMKNYDDFYQEAKVNTIRFQRESDSAYESRICEHANVLMTRYKNHIVQEGLFGFNKIKIDDEMVPSTVNVNLGPKSADNPTPYFIKLPVLFEVDNKHRLVRKQLESITRAVSNSDIFEKLASALLPYLQSKAPSDMNGVTSVWDVCVPTKIYVPVEPINEYKIFIMLKCDFLVNGEYEFGFSWHTPIKSDKSNKGIVENLAGKALKLTGENKMDFVKECYDNGGDTSREPSRFYQEAIDFGDEATDGDTAPASDDEPAVTPEDTNTQPTGDEETVAVDSNDVSDQIVDKVNETENQDGEVPSVDDTTAEPEVGEVPTGEENADETGIDDNQDVDGQLDELNDMGNTDASLDEPNVADDIDNMSIDELITSCSDKLKGMPINKLKAFLSSDGSEIPTADEGELEDVDNVQEAFILTSKNINKEIDIALRKALGVLNDNTMAAGELLAAFKKDGKALNKALSKGSKMKKVYTEDEIKSFIKLNKVLVDLTSVLKSDKDTQYDMTVKRLIQAFVSESAMVAKIVEGKLKTNKEGESNE